MALLGLVLGVGALGVGALGAGALAAQGLRISVNGRVVPGTVVNIGGQNYVPVSALSAAGFRVGTSGGTLSITAGGPSTGAASSSPSTTPGGSTPVTALEGCLSQTLFNGVWRVKFSNLRLVPDGSLNRWNIDLEVRNGTKDMMTGADGVLMADSLHLSYLKADGTPLAWGITDELNGQKFTFTPLPPSGVWRGTLTVADTAGSASRPPTKLLWQVRPGETPRKLPWGVKDPSFRIDLSCSK